MHYAEDMEFRNLEVFFCVCVFFLITMYTLLLDVIGSMCVFLPNGLDFAVRGFWIEIVWLMMGECA